MLSPVVVATVTGLLVTALLLLHRAPGPQPIPGIPYNQHASERLLGDIPERRKAKQTTSEVFRFVVEEAEKFDAPVFQLSVHRWTSKRGT